MKYGQPSITPEFQSTLSVRRATRMYDIRDERVEFQSTLSVRRATCDIHPTELGK